jgi:Family of unknown function (DUF6481)
LQYRKRLPRGFGRGRHVVDQPGRGRPSISISFGHLLFTEISLSVPVGRWYFAPGSLKPSAKPIIPRPTTDTESDKASSMSGFKEPSFADRQKAAQQARQDILNKFRAKPGPDDPEVKQRQAEREAQAAARAKVREAREAAKAEQKRLEEEAAAAAAALLAREKEEEAARLAALEAEQKAKRDARYAARKGGGKGKKK